jgi:uncharacterized protein YkwD
MRSKLPVLFICLAFLVSPAAAFAQNEMQTMLDMHNYYRARHCTPPLTWSPEVAAAAQRWANRCIYDHDRDNPLGENLAWGTQLSAREAVNLWYEEIGEYNYSAPGFGPAGHFTQLIWRGSKQVGCARAICPGYVYWICRYSPAGNYDSEFAQNVSPPCRR